MVRYVVERFLALLGVLLGISLLVFTLTAFAPGDPAAAVLAVQQPGITPSREAVMAMRAHLGLNDPLPVRYGSWLLGVLRGDLGRSYRTGQLVAAELAARLPATLLLTGSSLLVALLIGVPLGILAAVKHGTTWDGVSRILTLLGATLPSYVLSFVLILIFAVQLRWLPAFGSGSIRHLILPTIALAAGSTAHIARLMRAMLLEVLQQDYVRTAHAKGLSAPTVLLVHALRNALLPMVTIIGLIIGNLLSGTVVIEMIFSWYGIGKYAVDAIFVRDYPVIQATALYFAGVFVLVNFVVDVTYRWIDPKLRGV